MKKIKLGKEQAIQRIRHFCAYQERAQQEVRDRLYVLGMTKSEVEEILSDLISDNFLNEERFAIQFAGGHFRIKQWGKLKIQHALQQKRVSPVNIKKALKSINDSDYKKSHGIFGRKKMEYSQGGAWLK